MVADDAEWHFFDKRNIEAVRAGELDQRDDLLLVTIAQDHGIQLDIVETGFSSRFDAVEYGIELAYAGQATEALRARDLPVRWVNSDLLHLTVKFLGDVDSALVTDIEERLGEAAGEARQHTLTIEGMGAFPSLNRPQTVWAGCEPVPALELLQHGIETRFADLGFPVEGRPFRPHVTVGRVKRGTTRRDLVGFGDELERIQLSTTATAMSVELMESRLSRSGPQYRVVRSLEFGL